MRKHYCWLWDRETQGYWEITIDEDGKLYGFPNSRYDGTPANEIALLDAIFDEETEPENG